MRLIRNVATLLAFSATLVLGGEARAAGFTVAGVTWTVCTAVGFDANGTVGPLVPQAFWFKYDPTDDTEPGEDNDMAKGAAYGMWASEGKFAHTETIACTTPSVLDMIADESIPTPGSDNHEYPKDPSIPSDGPPPPGYRFYVCSGLKEKLHPLQIWQPLPRSFLWRKSAAEALEFSLMKWTEVGRDASPVYRPNVPSCWCNDISIGLE